MTAQKIIVLGAAGSLARVAIGSLLRESNAQLTLYLRDSQRMSKLVSERVRIVEGDVLDERALTDAIRGQDLVYANLAGEMERQATTVVKAMHVAGVRRLIFVSSMGIYDEAGEKFGGVLEPYRKSAAVIEASDLDYTVLRPAWFTDEHEVAYQTTQKGQRFIGSTVSRKSIADLIVKLSRTPQMAVRESLGIGKAQEDKR